MSLERSDQDPELPSEHRPGTPGDPLDKPPEGIDEILRNEPETPEDAEAEPRDWPEEAREIIDEKHADSARQSQDE